MKKICGKQLDKSLREEKDFFAKFSRELAKLPLFLPTSKRQYRKNTFECPYGTITVQGLSLNTFDENLLLAIATLGQTQFMILRHKGEDGVVTDVEQTDTIIWIGTKYQLLKAMGLTPSEKYYKMIDESLDALTSTFVKFECTIQDKDRKIKIWCNHPLVYSVTVVEENPLN